MPDEDLLTTPATPKLGLTVGTLMAVFLGGALGTLARYALDMAYPTPSGHFATTTLIINLSGSLAIGVAVPLAERLTPRISVARPFLVVGILGGWTTYSALAVDAVVLGKGGQVGLSLAFLAATLVGGVALVELGAVAARKALPA